MASDALIVWRAQRTGRLAKFEADNLLLESTHPTDPDRVQEYVRAFAMFLSAEFQGFCRDLHEECIAKLVAVVPDVALQDILLIQCRFGRKLDTGNPTPSNLGADFNRLGCDFWGAALARDPAHTARRHRLAALNAWRNAIAHHNYNPGELGGSTTLPLVQVQEWRVDCDTFAGAFDEVLRVYLLHVLGASPWPP